jgi:hypothetical protein
MVSVGAQTCNVLSVLSMGALKATATAVGGDCYARVMAPKGQQ